VSHGGTANRATGDLESAAQPAQPKAGARYSIRIDRIAE